MAKAIGRQRKVWNGSAVSCAAALPPKSCRLANPSSFLDVEIQPGQQVFFSKRDASIFFDVLQVPQELQTWFGQPPLYVSELIAGGLNMSNIASFGNLLEDQLTPDTQLFPVHAVWPMGFSWSSAVAQSTTVETYVKAGIKESAILSPDYELPCSFDETCFVATDDTVLIHKCFLKGRDTLDNLDRAFEENGIPRNKSKDISLAERITALGCDLSNGPAMAEPSAGKLYNAIRRTLDLLHTRRASPRGCHALFGVWQWFALLQRGFFSIYDRLYDFVRQEPSSEVMFVPKPALNELLTTLLLVPLFAARLDRKPLDMLIATDAAPEFGFGVSACACDSKIAVADCRLAERRGDHVRLYCEQGDTPEISRLGTPHRLPYKQSDFKTVISSKARWSAHSGVLEAHAYLLGLKWVCRHPEKHHCKIIDAKVVIGAAGKGRSSARALRTVLRSIAAHCLAADLLPRLVYIPSEANLADRPSRGQRNRPPVRPARKSHNKSRSFSRLTHHLERIVKAARIIQRWV